MTKPCKSGWNQLYGTDSCFKIITPGGFPTFDEAREGCLNRSSHLVRIDNDDANNQVYTIGVIQRRVIMMWLLISRH